MGPTRRDEVLSLSSRVLTVSDFSKLTSQEKMICLEHLRRPHLTKEDLAMRVKLPQKEVYAFFHSKIWEAINIELAKQEMRELVQLSIKALRECLISGKHETKLMASTRVLVNSGLLNLGNVKIGKQDNKVVVLWNEENKTQEILNGNQDTLQPALEAVGSSRIESQI